MVTKRKKFFTKKDKKQYMKRMCAKQRCDYDDSDSDSEGEESWRSVLNQTNRCISLHQQTLVPPKMTLNLVKMTSSVIRSKSKGTPRIRVENNCQ